MSASMHHSLVSITSGSVRIEGLLETPADPLGIVLFAHGSGSGRASPRNNFVASILRDAGLGTLLIDLLTEREAQLSALRFDIELLTQRLQAAATWLKRHHEFQAFPLGLFGASTGAAAALQVAAKPELGVGAVVSRGGRPDLAERQVLEKIGIPTLLLVGGLDEIVIKLNETAYNAMRCEKQLVIIPGATHLFEEPGTLEAVAELGKEWFLTHLQKAGGKTAGQVNPV